MTPSSILALRASHDRLRRLVEPLSGSELLGRAYPTEWSIAQVLSHLGSGAQINALIFEAGLAGEGAVDRALYQPIWDAWNAKSPSQQVADALETDRRLVERFEASPGPEARFSIWSGPTDVAGFALARLSEHAVHTWDVAVALDPTATVSPDAVDLLIDVLERMMPYAAKPTGRSAEVRVRTTSPSREFLLSIGDEVSLSPASGSPLAEPSAELVLPAEAFVRLVYGRLDRSPIDPSLREVFRGF